MRQSIVVYIKDTDRLDSTINQGYRYVQKQHFTWEFQDEQESLENFKGTTYCVATPQELQAHIPQSVHLNLPTTHMHHKYVYAMYLI